ncbi:MAG: DUF899 domain-containing protein [Alphaproteobacteria bacterium]|nr:DUF899 domain-containing protein [Alphaproteobacteria bacterium]
MPAPKIVSQQDWIAARKEHLAKEKEFTRLRDRLSAERRDLPWVRIEKQYLFDGPDGKQGLSDLFGGHSQLIVQHFMFGPDWEEGCPACSFWADGFNGFVAHFAHRDVTMVAVSNAALERLDAYKQRMGWTFAWLSSLGSDFNRDFNVTFTPEEIESENAFYNYETGGFPSTEAPGVSVFFKDDQGDIFHTYSCYARGLDMLNAAYHYLDLAPKGRDEGDLSFPMAWVRRHDQYED